ncbi:MAG: IS4 family transposase [Deltaproteobacteria bacterium]|nr:IS4 family transposase [Deltaproteobacteria bacterium]
MKQGLARKLLREFCANILEFLKKIIFSEQFLARHRQSDKNFVRNRILPFSALIFFLMNLIKGSLQDELDYFFKALNNLDVAARKVTESAFGKARKKLKHQSFIEFNEAMIGFFYKHFPYRTWYGFRLFAIDGPTIKVPKTQAVADHFGSWNPAKGEPCPLARISFFFDMLNKLKLHTILSPKENGERNLLAQPIRKNILGTKDLLLLDRGYPAFWLFVLILSTGADFCARVKKDHWRVIRTFFRSGKLEDIVWLQPSHASVQECSKIGLPFKPIKVRLIRVELDNGETEILITSLLDKNAYFYEIFKELYHKRWPIEEDYKAMKSRVEIENFSGKSVESVYQDFHARVFTANLTAAMVHPAQDVVEQQTQERQYFYQVNLTQALSKMKDTVVLFFNRSNIRRLISDLLDLFIKTIEPIRPDRKFPRKKGVKKQGFYPCYKPIR